MWSFNLNWSEFDVRQWHEVVLQEYHTNFEGRSGFAISPGFPMYFANPPDVDRIDEVHA
jgi:hypothetical protein